MYLIHEEEALYGKAELRCENFSILQDSLGVITHMRREIETLIGSRAHATFARGK
jgi:hypothetical protein